MPGTLIMREVDEADFADTLPLGRRLRRRSDLDPTLRR